MKQRSLACLAISATLLLSGCSSMLDREYLDITTHNAAPTTEGDTSILRADSYQELVNVLIYMVSTGAENGTIRLKMEPELLEEVFQEALTHLDRKAKEHTITVELPDDMLMAKMDARLIVQVVINIVNNAIKYTPPGSHVQVSARKRGESVEVRIADDGPGISERSMHNLFQVGYSTKFDPETGNINRGVGLPAVKSLTEELGGSVSVESQPGRGARFSVELPLHRVKGEKREK